MRREDYLRKWVMLSPHVLHDDTLDAYCPGGEPKEKDVHTTTSYKTTEGSIKLDFEAFGSLKDKLGDGEFKAWVDHQVAFAATTIACKFPAGLRKLTNTVSATPGRSTYRESFTIECDGTTVKVGVKFKFRFKLTAQQRASLAETILTVVRGHVQKHLGDKSRRDKLAAALSSLAIATTFGEGSLFPDLAAYKLNRPENFSGRFEKFVSGLNLEGSGFPDRSTTTSDQRD